MPSPVTAFQQLAVLPPVNKSGSPRTNRGRVKVLSRPAGESEAEKVIKEEVGSKQIQDPFNEFYETESIALNRVLRPPYRMETLKMLPIRNAILLQCIHALVTNCHSFGHSLVYSGEKGKEQTPEAEAEKVRIENILDFPNDHDSLGNIRIKTGTDYEILGNAYLEVGRNALGDVDFYYHVHGEKCRLCKVDVNPVLIKMTLMRNGKPESVTARRYFRRYVQLVGTKIVYFKEFGDPRTVNPKTGDVDNTLAPEDAATEMIHISQYWSGSPYGVPCWVNNMPAILGMREAELVNLQYFEDNAIPAMAVLVSGGSLSEETLLELQEKFVNSKGRDQVHRVVVIEAVADMDAAGDTDSAPPVPSLSIQPLRDAQQSDALFLSYDEASMTKIRGSFRLPPVYLGRSDDYTRATCDSSSQLAEIQVFTPRRNVFDDIINTKILSYKNALPKFWKFKSNGSKLVDPALILQALTVLEAVGAATPNLAIQVANDLFGLELTPIEDDWGSKPFEFMKAQLNAPPVPVTDKEGNPLPPKKPAFGAKPFDIKKEDMATLTRVTSTLAAYTDEQGRMDAELKEKIALVKAGKSPKTGARLRE